MTASEQVLSELIAKWEMRGKAEIREMLIAMQRRNECLDWSKAHYTKRIAEHALRARLSFKMVRKLKGLQ
jgi:hypothetical protein